MRKYWQAKRNHEYDKARECYMQLNMEYPNTPVGWLEHAKMEEVCASQVDPLCYYTSTHYLNSIITDEINRNVETLLGAVSY